MCKEDSLLEQVKPIHTGGGTHKGDENPLWNDPTGGVTQKEGNNPPPSQPTKPPQQPEPPPVKEPEYVNFNEKR